MVWVKSTTRLNDRGSLARAGAAGITAAAAPAAAAMPVPLKKPRRLSRLNTASWHPGTHISPSPLVVDRLPLIGVATGSVWRRPDWNGRPSLAANVRMLTHDGPPATAVYRMPNGG